ncbi:uncharacterized protein A4U43_C08F4770 [Asparagus officinalis]|nr:uncharacterized protein A4U43_C08F4770 [Asparagus officinalis]
MSPPPRILLCGDPLGHLNQLFKRVQSVNKSSGPFDALLCVGQFFPESDEGIDEVADYVEGRCSVPIPTYFTGDYGAGAARFLSKASNLGFKTDGIEVCANLYWLKGSGKFSLHGLSMVYLSGRKYPDAGGRDITNEWPSGVSEGADTTDALPAVSDPWGSDPVVAELAAELKPRYHVAGSKGIFYARQPYSNTDSVHVTRFLGLAAVGNKDKQKFIHAISPIPASTMSAAELQSKPLHTTSSPYMIAAKPERTGEATKRPANSDIDVQYWRYDVSRKRQRQGGPERLCFTFTSTGSCSLGEKCNFRHDTDAREQYLRNVCFDFLNKGKCERGPDCRFTHNVVDEGVIPQRTRTNGGRKSSGKNCWFCLSSPDVESHLILSLGETYYCALAKGPLVQDHVLLIPIEHHPDTLTMPSEAEKELGIYKNALSTYFKNQGKAVVFFEWIFQGIPHANLQGVPIPLSKASRTLFAFNFAAKQLEFEFTVLSKSSDNTEGRNLLRSQFDGKSNLFYAELPDGTILSYATDDKNKLHVQFGREVLAGLLKLTDRDNWKKCVSKEDETKMAENFKKGFQEFDPAR